MGTVISQHSRLARGAITALLAACAALLAPPVQAVEASLARDVPAGQWSGVELKNLPEGAVLDVVVESDEPIVVALTDSSFGSANPAKPLFAGTVQKRLSFSISTRKAGHHYLILDNRKGAVAADVTLSVEARRGDEAPAIGGTTSVSPAGDEILAEFEQALHRIFIFEPISIRVASCEKPNAYTVRGQIRLCAEYVQRIQAETGDKTLTQDVLVFALFHELGHALMEQWQLPFYDDEEVADQFATATLMMLGQQQRTEAVVSLFSSRSTLAEADAKARGESRHPLSAERARNISRWVQAPDTLPRWFNLYRAHMQTTFLEQLLSRDPPWLDEAAVRAELRGRTAT